MVGILKEKLNFKFELLDYSQSSKCKSINDSSVSYVSAVLYSIES
jgi:predicted class III extradiol MEMO1 family dioxygenase